MADDGDGVTGAYPASDELAHEDEAVVGPYPGEQDEDAVVGPYPGEQDEDAVVGPYPGGGDDDDNPYPNTDDQFGDDVVGPYPGGDEEDAYPDSDAQYGAYPDTDEQYGGAAYDAIGPSAGPAAPPAAPPGPAAHPQPAAAPPAPPPPCVQRWHPPDWSKPPQLHQPKIEAYENGRCARSMSLRGSSFFIIGRNGQQADIVVADHSVSRAHAAIINSSSATFITDMDSAHGTFYDESGRTAHIPQLGVRLDPKGEPTKLVDGATIRFGTFAGTVFKIVGLQVSTVERWKPPRWAVPPRTDRALLLEVRSTSVRNPYLEHLAAEGGDVDEVSMANPAVESTREPRPLRARLSMRAACSSPLCLRGVAGADHQQPVHHLWPLFARRRGVA